MGTPPRPRQLDSPLLPKIFRVMSRAHVWVYRRTRGRIGGKWRVGAGFRKPVPVLLLDHRGRKSGRLLTTPVLYAVHGDDLLVVASQGGLEAHPQWYRNLCAAPETSVQIRGERRAVRARVADAEERAALWPVVVEVYADFDTYQSWASREIPLIVLSPR
ncbi:nitroreductase family deazaflavin-dependent oxidoreductase [Cryptosporangium aurantiacum]|uniref:Deazaflavin-dependent oxidoreductase, nitroreductase family n=1 Tax=Cryptosporangium aurantiacum TaxID=134849 RepID=A0A1M7K637_9ACTN|nr:nitroreductase family deazaflavin-dependent oxidoreductase [Cryptosporangium aurantiacum]SHM60718.1 deazaflavin-dependent oxidoreductase, nitroreductase family [Cryptosporangium aurantiacum]